MSLMKSKEVMQLELDKDFMETMVIEREKDTNQVQELSIKKMKVDLAQDYYKDLVVAEVGMNWNLLMVRLISSFRYY